MKHPKRLSAVLSAAAVLLLCLQPSGLSQQAGSAAVHVVASCDFEGPYSQGEHQIHDGCVNNWQWGRKDMRLTADRNCGRPGTAQRIQVRGIASGALQFFYRKLKLKKDRFYRVTCWMKSDGLEGPLYLHVRKGDYPWTEYLPGEILPIPGEWSLISITGKCPEDVPEDVGVCWEAGWMGTIWIDDLKVEESEQPFDTGPVSPSFLGREGENMLPRSSFEGRRDALWSTKFFGWNRNGVWEGVEGCWEDPQMYRAEGGKVGRYCMASPSAQHAGQAGTLMFPLDVLPGKPYTVSAWMKASEAGYPASLALLYYRSGRHMQPLASVYPKLTTDWQRVSFTGVPQHPPGSADTASPVKVYLQLAPSPIKQGIVYVDALQLERGDTATDYKPAHPLELYADIGQDGGNLLEWDAKLPLNLLAAAADQTPITQTRVEVTIVGYPDTVVWKRTLSLVVNEETRLTLDVKCRGLFRVEMRPVNPTEAAAQEMLFALVPPIRNTGEKGMFGTHISIRPFLVSYIRRLGFTWTRLHDASLISKWFVTEREPGKFLWHDDVVEGVRKGGLNILGLPDHPPEWARVKQEGANPVNVEAYGRYCEQLARHYAGKIDCWELWNEPYMPKSYGGGAERFGELLQAGYAGIKRGNPQAKVLGWCADISNPGWGAKIPEQARRCIDIFTFHNYPTGLTGGGTLPFAAELADHRKLWPPHVTECWNTEGANGYVCANSFYTFMPLLKPGQNDRATAFASRVWIEHANQGISKFFTYQMHNVDTMSYYGGYQSLLIGYDRTPTPAAVAVAVTAYCMDGLKSLPCSAVEGVVQGLFSGDGRATWVVYDDAGVIGRKKLDLTQLPPDAEVLDVMGNDPRRDGKQDWEIGIQPLFLLSAKLSAEELATVARGSMGMR